jgi:hypothetical protein
MGTPFTTARAKMQDEKANTAPLEIRFLRRDDEGHANAEQVNNGGLAKDADQVAYLPKFGFAAKLAPPEAEEPDSSRKSSLTI